MSTSISTCPSCKTLLLEDTIQCPSCNYVLDAKRYAPLANEPMPSQVGSQTVEQPCPDCGEMVRSGLVRCWNCGAFMQAEIAEQYRKMQTSSPVLYTEDPNRQIPEDEHGQAQYKLVSDDEDEDEHGDARGDDAGGDDFELAPEIQAKVTRAASSKSGEAADSPAADAGDGKSDANGAAAEGDDEKAKQPADADESDQPHSVATGGDALLQVALEEEKEGAARRSFRGRRRARRAPLAGHVMVFCPNGHRIEVAEKYRGLAGRCPKCKSVFVVPAPPPEPQPAEKAESAEGAAKPASLAAGKYKRWLSDVHVHALNPAKLKLKPGSLQSTFQLMDLGFASDGLLAATLVKAAGLSGSAAKKRPGIRQTMIEYLSDADKPLSELPVAEHQFWDADKVRMIKVVQPAAYEYESQFAGVPVFGENRIAVRLPKFDNSNDQFFASFELAGFRAFAGDLAEMYGVPDLGEDCGVPLTDSYVDLKCHYSEETLHVLEKVEFYQADPSFELELIGWRCQGCSLVVSEDSRKKENIGGKNPKSVAKAKCPKCQQKFGNQPLYTLKVAPAPEPEAAEPPSEEAAPSAETKPAEAEATKSES